MKDLLSPRSATWMAALEDVAAPVSGTSNAVCHQSAWTVAGPTVPPDGDGPSCMPEDQVKLSPRSAELMEAIMNPHFEQAKMRPLQPKALFSPPPSPPVADSPEDASDGNGGETADRRASSFSVVELTAAGTRLSKLLASSLAIKQEDIGLADSANAHADSGSLADDNGSHGSAKDGEARRDRTVTRLSLSDARTQASDRLSANGHRDRKSGTFLIPEIDTKEPARTERLLAKPFQLVPARLGDRFQSVEGYLYFRVNGRTRIGTCYRLIVVGVNMMFGILSGLQPLIPPVTLPALIQTFCIVFLQFIMAFVCFYVLPDADRIISRFAGSQFLIEGLASLSLLVADRRARDAMLGVEPNATTTAPDGRTLDGFDAEMDDYTVSLQSMGFVLSLLAMAVPMLQLIEQRCMTPSLNLVKNKGGNPLVLCAAFYMLASSLPRQILAFMTKADAGETDAAQAAGSASAGAGDEVAGGEAEGPEAGGGNDGITDGIGTAAAEAGRDVSKLLARGLAAKEAAAKSLALPTVPEDAQGDSTDGFMASIQMLARMRANLETQRRLQEQSIADEDTGGDDGGDGGDDF